jgi:curved DNA-binding protein
MEACMKYKNYYEILSVTRKSSKEEIKLSYRKLAKKYHPDSNSNDNNDVIFKDINEAYDVLMNDEKRKKYDRQVARLGFGFSSNPSLLPNIRYEFKSGATVINELFSTILGLKKNDNSNIDNVPKQKPEKGKDIISTLEVTLEEGLKGTEKKIAVKGYKGSITTFNVNVPIGIKHADKIRLAALGYPGKNGGKNGDLIIHVKLIENPEFKLKDIDLIKEITISPSTAVLGGNYKVTLFGESINLTLPKYISNNEYLTFYNYGYINEDGKRGNLLLNVTIDIPKNITDREEKLYEQILKIEKKRSENN